MSATWRHALGDAEQLGGLRLLGEVEGGPRRAEARGPRRSMKLQTAGRIEP